MEISPFVLAVLLFVSMIVGIQGERMRAKWARWEWRNKRGHSKKKFYGKPKLSKVGSGESSKPFDAAEHAAKQLQLVMAAAFDRKKLLNSSEFRLLETAEKYLGEMDCKYRLMAQVSLGEILYSKDKEAYLAINSKRVDLLLIDENSMPLHVIEYQGKGHYQGNAAARDAVKKEALRRGGIGYSEICAGDKPSDLKTLLAKLTDTQRLSV